MSIERMPVAEIATDLLIAIMRNPNINPKDTELAALAVSHTHDLLANLESQHVKNKH